jgi:uncharacterized membrane protein required for colicin V production
VRGFFRTIFGLLSWIGAAVLTLFLLPLIYPIIEPIFGGALWVLFVVSTALFLGCFIVCVFVAEYLTQLVRTGAMRPADTVFGFFLGCFKGALLVSLVYWSVVALVPRAKRETILETVTLRPWLDYGQRTLQHWVDAWIASPAMLQLMQDKFEEMGQYVPRLRELKREADDVLQDPQSLQHAKYVPYAQPVYTTASGIPASGMPSGTVAGHHQHTVAQQPSSGMQEQRILTLEGAE